MKHLFAKLFVLAAVLLGAAMLIGCGRKQILPGDSSVFPAAGQSAVWGQPDQPELKINLFEAGKADAILLQVGDRDYLVDTGLYENGNDLVEKLRALGVERIHGIFLTHPHRDHIGGMAAVLDRMPVDKVYCTAVRNDGSRLWKKVRKLLAAKEIPVETLTAPADVALNAGAVCKVLWPEAELLHVEGDADINPNSLVMLFSYKGFRMMFTGDAYKETEKAILERYPVSTLHANVLKAGHHSNKSSNGEEWIRAVSPEAVVISCGNKPGDSRYPNKGLLKRLRALGIRAFNTWEQGSITITSDGKHYYITAER